MAALGKEQAADEDEGKRRSGRARCGAAGQGRGSVLDPVVLGGGGV